MFFNSSGQIRSHGVSCLVSHSVSNWCYWDLTDVTLARKQKPYCWCWQKSSSNFVGVSKKSHILVIFPFLAPGVFDPYMAPLVHTWSAFFCSHDTNWEAEFQTEDSGGLWSFERLVPESFCFWFDHSSRHDYRMFLWRGRLFPTSPVRYRSFVLSIW